MFIHLSVMDSQDLLLAISAKILKPVSSVSGLPRHRQAEDSLRLLVAHPHLQNGALLPDELTIANRLGVSRGTARTALAKLVHEGLVERRAGVGTRTVRPPVESGAGAWRSFTREMARKGITVETYHSRYSKRPAPEVVALALQVKPSAPLARLDRLRGWDGLPVLHSRSWFHPRLRLAADQDYSRPLYELVEAATGVVADRAREELTAVPAGARLAALLLVSPGEPLLCRRHLVFDTAGRPMEYAEVHYVSTRFTLTMDLRREPA